MAYYWRQMFNTAGESTTLAALNQGTSAATNPFPPPVNGRLLKVVVLIGYEAATSLVEDVRIELTCTLWTPNRLEFFGAGAGLHTAPGGVAPMLAVHDVDQPVRTDTTIDGNYIHDSGVPVTSRIRVFGMFSG